MEKASYETVFWSARMCRWWNDVRPPRNSGALDYTADVAVASQQCQECSSLIWESASVSGAGPALWFLSQPTAAWLGMMAVGGWTRTVTRFRHAESWYPPPGGQWVRRVTHQFHRSACRIVPLNRPFQSQPSEMASAADCSMSTVCEGHPPFFLLSLAATYLDCLQSFPPHLLNSCIVVGRWIQGLLCRRHTLLWVVQVLAVSRPRRLKTSQLVHPRSLWGYLSLNNSCTVSGVIQCHRVSLDH